MWRYIVKRVLVLLPLIFLVSFIVYALMDLAPGDPVRMIVGESATEEQIEIMRENLGYNDNLFVRYGRYVGNIFQGNFGQSIYGKKDVLTEYMSRLPYTLWLAIVSITFTTLISIPFGVLAAVKQNTWVDTLLSGFAMCGISIPGFWLGIMLILLFSLNLGWFPVSGAGAWNSVILPAITLGVANASLSTRTTRSAVLDTIRADYLRTARAKGVKERVVIYKHALGNALIPIVTILGSQFSGLFAGAMIVENVFAWPGIGTLTITAIRANDVTLATGCSILTTILTSVTLLAVDILYAYIDPRVKAQYTGR